MYTHLYSIFKASADSIVNKKTGGGRGVWCSSLILFLRKALLDVVHYSMFA